MANRSRPRQGRRKAAGAKRKRVRRQEHHPQLMSQRLLRIAAFLVGLIGLIAAVLGIDSYISSRISVLPESPIDPSDSFSTPFKISNDGWLTINDVQVNCHYEKVLDVHENTLSDIGVGGYKFKELKANHPLTVQCHTVHLDSPFRTGDIIIEVSHRPSFIPWRKEERFKYHIERGSDGVLHWMPAGS
jgi:hypothetical protein